MGSQGPQLLAGAIDEVLWALGTRALSEERSVSRRAQCKKVQCRRLQDVLPTHFIETKPFRKIESHILREALKAAVQAKRS